MFNVLGRWLRICLSTVLLRATAAPALWWVETLSSACHPWTWSRGPFWQDRLRLGWAQWPLPLTSCCGALLLPLSELRPPWLDFSLGASICSLFGGVVDTLSSNVSRTGPPGIAPFSSGAWHTGLVVESLPLVVRSGASSWWGLCVAKGVEGPLRLSGCLQLVLR